MHRYKAAIFDLDGTLLDTSEGIIAAVRYTTERYGLRSLNEEEIKSFIGPPIQHSFGRIYGVSGAELAELAGAFRDRYKDYDLLKAVAYDGIFDVFEALSKSGNRSAVSTYKRQDYAERILRHFGFDRYTDIMWGSDFEGKLTKSDIILKSLASAGITDRSDAVMIGDSDNDAKGAALLGLDFVGVTYGFGFKTADDIAEFPNVGKAARAEELINIIIGEQK